MVGAHRVDDRPDRRRVRRIADICLRDDAVEAQVLDLPPKVFRVTAYEQVLRGLCPRVEAHRILGFIEPRERAPVRAMPRAGDLYLCPRGSPQ